LISILNHGISANALHQTSISTRNIEGLNMKKLALALAATAAFAGQAIAADIAVKAARPAPPPVPVANWTGCYVAGSVGYGLFDNETSGTDRLGVTGLVPPGGLLIPRTDYGGRGWLAGGGGGCDYQFGFGGGGGIFGTGQFVIGFLGDYYWSDMRGDRGSVFSGNFFTGQEKVDSQWAVGGRVGWLVNPNTLTYFSGGYTEAKLTGVGNFFSPVAPPVGGFSGIGLPGRTVQGYFLGGGVEYQSGWLPGLTWKTEYRFSEYDRVERAEFFNTPPIGPVGTFSSDKLFTQTVMTSLVYRFNVWGPPVAARY
jgi:outer membrane immunogenic protein